jgi:hypothetical protein
MSKSMPWSGPGCQEVVEVSPATVHSFSGSSSAASTARQDLGGQSGSQVDGFGISALEYAVESSTSQSQARSLAQPKQNKDSEKQLRRQLIKPCANMSLTLLSRYCGQCFDIKCNHGFACQAWLAGTGNSVV